MFDMRWCEADVVIGQLSQEAPPIMQCAVQDLVNKDLFPVCFRGLRGKEYFHVVVEGCAPASWE